MKIVTFFLKRNRLLKLAVLLFIIGFLAVLFKKKNEEIKILDTFSLPLTHVKFFEKLDLTRKNKEHVNHFFFEIFKTEVLSVNHKKKEISTKNGTLKVIKIQKPLYITYQFESPQYLFLIDCYWEPENQHQSSRIFYQLVIKNYSFLNQIKHIFCSDIEKETIKVKDKIIQYIKETPNPYANTH